MQTLFQSHNGAIAARMNIVRATIAVPSFNPTMVRLLRAKAAGKRRGEVVGFNPTMVRLLHEPKKAMSVEDLEVSIPQWCDCCQASDS